MNDKNKIKINVWTTKIQNHNADGLCAESYCDKPITHYFQININGLELHIALCEEHASKINRIEVDKI